MLGNKKTVIKASGKTTLVSSDTVIKGDVRFSGVLDIEGLVQGNIVAQPGKDAVVRIVDKGRVEGEIRAPSIIINGVVQGDVYSTRHLELAAKAKVKGNVFYSLVEMAAGAEVNGSLAHMAQPDPAKEKKGEASPAGNGPGKNQPGVAATPAKLD